MPRLDGGFREKEECLPNGGPTAISLYWLACPEEAENRGLNAEDILAGMLWRGTRLKGGEIAAREDG